MGHSCDIKNYCNDGMEKYSVLLYKTTQVKQIQQEKAYSSPTFYFAKHQNYLKIGLEIGQHAIVTF